MTDPLLPSSRPPGRRRRRRRGHRGVLQGPPFLLLSPPRACGSQPCPRRRRGGPSRRGCAAGVLVAHSHERFSMEEVLDAYHRGGATTTMGDGTTMSREDVLELVIAKSEAEDPETEFYFVPRDVVLAFQAAPPSSSAVEENGGQHASLPRFQTLLEREQLVKKKVSLRGAVRGDYRGAFAAASHRWEDPAIPDHSGEQIARAQQYLRSHPSVEYFWFDFWSMPQCAFDDSRDASTGELVHFGCKRDDRTPEEKDEFGTMLRRVNSLYLGMEALLIMDLSYVSRFWTQFEAWLAMQQTTDAGLSSAVGASGGAQRYEVMGVLNARDMSEQQLEMIEKMWGTATPEEAHAKLSHKDVTVTNQGDKEFQLKKIKTLQLSVRLARAAVAAERSSPAFSRCKPRQSKWSASKQSSSSSWWRTTRTA